MIKAAHEAKPDLVNWLRPKLKVKRKTENERRVVQGGVESDGSVGSAEERAAKPLQNKQLAL